MLKRILNLHIKQNLIIFLLGVLQLIFCIAGELLSLDKAASFPYFILGIICSFIIILNANKIKIFSPLYNFFATFFFAITFSAFYYFDKPIEEFITNRPILQSGTVIDDVNVLFFLFGISMLIPITISLYMKYKLPKIKIPNIHVQNINLVILTYIMFCIITLFLLLALSDMSLISALSNPLGFRNNMKGAALFPKLLLLTILNALLIICYFDIFKKNNKIKPWIKVLLFFFLIFYTVISGSRGILVAAFIYIITIYFYTCKIKVKHICIGFVLLSLLLSFNSIYLKYRNTANDLANGNIQGAMKTHSKKINVFKDFAERNDSFINTICFFNYINREYANGNILSYNPNHGVEEIIYHISSYIPRKHKDKIFGKDKGGLFPLHMTDKIYNNATFYYNVGFDMGGISNLYWMFGIFGVIIGGFLFGIFTALFHELFDKYILNEFFIVIYLLVFYLPMDMFFKTGFVNSSSGVNFLFNLIIVILIFIPFFKKIKLKF